MTGTGNSCKAWRRSRNMKPEDGARRSIAAGPYKSDDAPATGLVDRVAYGDDFA